jgi:S-formylglutathione hydrolase FrmB
MKSKHTINFVGLVVLSVAIIKTSPPAAASIKKVTPLHPQIELVTFHSQVLDADKRFAVVLPKGYAGSNERWPVVFLFHGRGRHERSLIEQPASRSALRQARFVTVLPDGDDGWYINSPAQPAARYAAYTEEVLATAQHRYRLSPKAAHRGLAGWSMGGYGCVRFAQNHPKQFSAVGSILGLLDFPRNGLPAGQRYEVPEDRFGQDPATWRKLNPMTHARRLRSMDLLLITGRNAFDRTMNQHFARRLEKLGIDHDLVTLDGAHTFDLVQRALPRVIAFMERSIAR